jgi:nucleoside-diphosphate-sugar epimerase
MFGVTQFIGRAVVERALVSGQTVAFYHRGEHESEGMSDVPHIHGDNADIEDHLDAIKAFGPDAVIDTTQFDTPRTQGVVDALTGVIGRYVLVSSMDVYIAYGRLHRTEPGPLQPVPINEEGELRTLLGFSESENYNNLDIERVALGQDALAVTITRLPAVFGPRDTQNRIGSLIEKLRESGDELRLHPANANFRWSRGYVGNVADMLLACAADRRPGNRIYNLGYPEGTSNIELYEMVVDVIGWEGRIVVTEDGTDPPKEDLTQHFTGDISKFRREFNYSDRVSMEEAVKLTVANVLAGE